MRTTYQKENGNGFVKVFVALIVLAVIVTAFYAGKHTGYSQCVRHAEASVMQGLDSAFAAP